MEARPHLYSILPTYLEPLRVLNAEQTQLPGAQDQAHAVVVGGEGGHHVDTRGTAWMRSQTLYSVKIWVYEVWIYSYAGVKDILGILRTSPRHSPLFTPACVTQVQCQGAILQRHILEVCRVNIPLGEALDWGLVALCGGMGGRLLTGGW